MAARPDTRFQGERVSWAWGMVLQVVARRVDFRLNSGRRTRAEQERLIADKGLWSPANPTGAAAYSEQAPHIRKGRQDHALDLDTKVGDGENAVQRKLARLGVRTRNPIPLEPWHLEAVDEDELVAVARRLRDPLHGYPAVERDLIRRHDAVVRRLRHARSARDRDRAEALDRSLDRTRKAIRARRKAVWRAAQTSGWERARRAARYRSLSARS